MKILSNNLDLVCGGGTISNMLKIGICGTVAWYTGNLKVSTIFTGVKVASKIGSEKGIDLDSVANEFCAVVGVEVIRPLVRNQ